MVCLNRPYPFKFFKGCLRQILLGPFLNTLLQMILRNAGSMEMYLQLVLIRSLFRTRDQSFSTYGNLSEKLTFLTPRYAHLSVYQGVKNVSFSGNFAYLLKECSLQSIIYNINNYKRYYLLFNYPMNSFMMGAPIVEKPVC